MRGYFDNDFFGGHFGPSTCPGRGDFSGHRGTRPGFGPFGHRQEHHQHGPDHHRCGPTDDEHHKPRCGHHGCESDSEGPAERHCHGPPGFRGCDGRRPNFRGHGPSCHGPCFGCSPPTCPFRGDFSGHRGTRPGFGPFSHRFDHSPERQGHHQHGPDHHRCGPTDDEHHRPRCGHHGCESDSAGPTERHCHGPPGFRGCDGRRPNFRGHGPSCHGPCFGCSPERHCFGRRGPSDFPDCPWRGPWEGPWGPDCHMHGFGRGGARHPWFSHRRPCPCYSEEQPSRNADCEKCREKEPCCSGNKENVGRGKGSKENGTCCDEEKDQNLGDRVLVQRIVLEKETRPHSV